MSDEHLNILQSLIVDRLLNADILRIQVRWSIGNTNQYFENDNNIHINI